MRKKTDTIFLNLRTNKNGNLINKYLLYRTCPEKFSLKGCVPLGIIEFTG
jgi:hypothetical protein